MSAKKPDYFAILGLTNDANDDEIRAVYKKLALQWHPDRHLSGKEHAAQMFIDVNTAYHALMDGKESAHSAPAENSSVSSCSNTGSTGAAPSESTAKSTQPSSRPPSDSKKSSRAKRPRDTPLSTSAKSRRSRPGNSKSDHASSTHSSASRNDTRSHPENNAKERSRFGGMKGRRHASKSQDHLCDPPKCGGKSPSPSTFAFSARTSHSNGTSASKADNNPDDQSEKSSHGHADGLRADKPVIPPSSGRLHKASRFGLADDFIHRLSRGTKGKKDRQDHTPHVDDVPPLGSPLRAMRSPRGTSKEWIFPLPMTLEDIFHGSRHRFLIKRELLSHKIEEVEICIHVPAGTRTSTRIVCPGAGHQCRDGTFQDVVFLIEDEPEQRFSRVNDDLYLDICVPWQDSLADQGGDICIDGLDGEEIVFPLPYPVHDYATEGRVFVKGAGMPIRRGRKIVGRGDMIVRWQVVFTVPSKWQAFKRAFRMKP
ncbi:hypothetical protein EDC04DRAFT_2866739 [Pisolithus marmoratus]|nr:hypothetical protein EDC04DRAFT_2866739 [Pisolithus marmoratus]